MARFSIIIPVYNVEKYLKQCVESVIRQSFKDVEIILIDDGSKDGSGKICDDFAKRDPRIKVIHKKNGGVSAARNQGLKTAKGMYILFLDSDDYVEKDYLKRINELTKDDDCLLIFNHHILYKNKRIVSDGKNQTLDVDSLQELILADDGYCGYVWNKVFKKSVIDKHGLLFDRDLSMNEDLLFVFQYTERIKKAKTVEDVLIDYRQRKSSSVSKKVKDIRSASIPKVYEYVIKNSRTESTKIKAEALYLKAYFKYKKSYVDNSLIQGIMKYDYKKFSSRDKKIITMYRYMPVMRTFLYGLKNVVFKRFE